MKTFKISAGIAITSFAIGTILFALQMITKDTYELAIIGFYFVCAAVVINCIVLLTLVGRLLIYDNNSENLKSIGVILANIPIALIYLQLVFTYSFN